MLQYTKVGDYLIPNLIPNKQPEKTYTKWGELRQEYLKEHRLGEYNLLVIKAELIAHLNEIDEQAWEMWERLMSQLEEKNPPPTQGTMVWVQWQNNLRNIANEFVLKDLIYN